MQLKVIAMQFSASTVSAFAILIALTQPGLAGEACKAELRAPAAQCLLPSGLNVTAARPGSAARSPILACAVQKGEFCWRVDDLPRNDGRALSCFVAEPSVSWIAAVTE
jgi:hypothetical protein